LATEEGIVVRTLNNLAWVKTQRSSACESCGSRDACQGSGGGKEMEVEVLNSIGAISGDRVQIGFDTGKLMGISFFLYIFPIILLIVGAVLGQKFSSSFHISEAAGSALGGFGFFGLAFLIVRWGSGAFLKKNEYQPKISKIVHKAASADSALRD
jgi:sigma-E factor negative regulatory protein RseC